MCTLTRPVWACELTTLDFAHSLDTTQVTWNQPRLSCHRFYRNVHLIWLYWKVSKVISLELMDPSDELVSYLRYPWGKWTESRI